METELLFDHAEKPDTDDEDEDEDKAELLYNEKSTTKLQISSIQELQQSLYLSRIKELSSNKEFWVPNIVKYVYQSSLSPNTCDTCERALKRKAETCDTCSRAKSVSKEPELKAKSSPCTGSCASKAICKVDLSQEAPDVQDISQKICTSVICSTDKDICKSTGAVCPNKGEITEVTVCKCPGKKSEARQVCKDNQNLQGDECVCTTSSGAGKELKGCKCPGKKSEAGNQPVTCQDNQNQGRDETQKDPPESKLSPKPPSKGNQEDLSKGPRDVDAISKPKKEKVSPVVHVRPIERKEPSKSIGKGQGEKGKVQEEKGKGQGGKEKVPVKVKVNKDKGGKVQAKPKPNNLPCWEVERFEEKKQRERERLAAGLPKKYVPTRKPTARIN